MIDILISSAIIIGLFNLYVTIRLWCKDGFNRFQKIAQSIIIWVFPVLGAILILTFIKDDETPKGPYNRNNGQGVDGMPGGVQ